VGCQPKDRGAAAQVVALRVRWETGCNLEESEQAWAAATIFNLLSKLLTLFDGLMLPPGLAIFKNLAYCPPTLAGPSAMSSCSRAVCCGFLLACGWTLPCDVCAAEGEKAAVQSRYSTDPFPTIASAATASIRTLGRPICGSIFPRAPFAERDVANPIVPGKPEESEVFRRITSDDPMNACRRPTRTRHLRSLRSNFVRRWIEEGAEYQPHWAFIMPVEPEVPRV